MKILLSGGQKTENIRKGIAKKFVASGDEFIVENFLDTVNTIYERGEYYDKAIITEQSITQEYTIKDEKTIRQRINDFAIASSKKQRKATFVFLTQNEEIAHMIYEEIAPIENFSNVVLKAPPYSVQFFVTLVVKDVKQLPEDYLYHPPVIGAEEDIEDNFGNDTDIDDFLGLSNSDTEEAGRFDEVQGEEDETDFFNNEVANKLNREDNEVYTGDEEEFTDVSDKEVYPDEEDDYFDSARHNDFNDEDDYYGEDYVADEVYDGDSQGYEEVGYVEEDGTFGDDFSDDDFGNDDSFGDDDFGNNDFNDANTQDDYDDEYDNYGNYEDEYTNSAPVNNVNTAGHLPGFDDDEEDFGDEPQQVVQQTPQTQQVQQVQQPETEPAPAKQKKGLFGFKKGPKEQNVQAEQNNQPAVQQNRNSNGGLGTGVSVATGVVVGAAIANAANAVGNTASAVGNVVNKATGSITHVNNQRPIESRDENIKNNGGNRMNNQFNGNYVNDDFVNDDGYLPGFDEDDDYGDSPNIADDGGYGGFDDDDYYNQTQPDMGNMNNMNMGMNQQNMGMMSNGFDNSDYEQVTTNENSLLGNNNGVNAAMQAGISAGATAANGAQGKGKGILSKLRKNKNATPEPEQTVAPTNNITAGMPMDAQGSMIQSANVNRNVPKPKNRNRHLDVNKIREALKPFALRGTSMAVTGFGGSGTSTIAYSLANIIYQLGYTVLLVDFDIAGRTQNYISRTNFEAMESDGANLMAAVNSSTGLNKQLVTVKSGFHLLTMGIGADISPIEELIHKDKIVRFLNNAKAGHQFVIYDMTFKDATNFLADVTYNADNIVLCADASCWGITKMMLNVCNCSSEDMQDTLFNRAQVVINKDMGTNKVFGQKFRDTRELMNIVDNQVFDLIGDDPGFYFKDLVVSGVIDFDPRMEDGWFENTHFSDVRAGQEVFLELLSNIILRK